MKVKVLIGNWIDKKEKKVRKVGEEFICSKARFEEIQKGLKKYKNTDWIEEIKEKK